MSSDAGSDPDPDRRVDTRGESPEGKQYSAISRDDAAEHFAAATDALAEKVQAGSLPAPVEAIRCEIRLPEESDIPHGDFTVTFGARVTAEAVEAAIFDGDSFQDIKGIAYTHTPHEFSVVGDGDPGSTTVEFTCLQTGIAHHATETDEKTNVIRFGDSLDVTDSDDQ